MHRPPIRSRVGVTIAAVASIVAASCGAGEPGGEAGAAQPEPERPVVVTTVSPITSIVSAVVRDHAEVVGIVPEGSDSHTFEPPPSVAELLSRADVVYLNGLQLEETTAELAEANVRDGAGIVELGEMAIPPEQWLFDESYPREGGAPNPHLWTAPRLAGRYAEVVAADMAARDPSNAAAYRANAADFTRVVDQLDAAMRASFATIERPLLLTYHDAYAYVAQDYGLELIGAIQVADVEEPSPADVAELIEQIRREGVPAIFGSEVFPSPVLEQISRETGARYVDDLRDDDLPGAPGDAEHSWLGLMLFDYVTITEALGGDASALRAIDPTAMVVGDAEYPQ